MKKEKLIKKYDKHAEMYEKNRENPTLVKWRKKLIPHAYGKVLEVGVGAGANFPYYNKDVQLTGVDFSPEMIKSAYKAADLYNMNVTLVQEDVDHLHYEDHSFDCIVSTLSLCSYPNPLETLKNFQKWCRPDGKLLFLEHGLSSSRFLIATQKVINPIFKKVSGCHCNRDMLKLIREAGIHIERTERYWKGVFQLIWAKP